MRKGEKIFVSLVIGDINFLALNLEIRKKVIGTENYEEEGRSNILKKGHFFRLR